MIETELFLVLSRERERNHLTLSETSIGLNIDFLHLKILLL
jgi:hypothetical protein